MPSLCQTLQKEYEELKKLQKKYEAALDEAVRTGKTEKTRKIRKQIEENLASLKEKIVPGKIKAVFTNPETGEQKEITLNPGEEIREWQLFYEKHNLPVPREKEIKQIWQKNHREIQKEMEKYGYDEIMIMPENLPDTEKLNQELIESMPNTIATWQSNNFTSGGGLAGAKHTENPKTRIILCHSDQDIYKNSQANIFARRTLGKDIAQLSGLDQAEIKRRIQNQEKIPLDFETEINGKKIKIQSEGLSLNEYLIFQRRYFEKTGKHLDEQGWTWLPRTFSASRGVNSCWDPGDRQLDVDVDDPGHSGGGLGCRLSRSFSG